MEHELLPGGGFDYHWFDKIGVIYEYVKVYCREHPFTVILILVQVVGMRIPASI